MAVCTEQKKKICHPQCSLPRHPVLAMTGNSGMAGTKDLARGESRSVGTLAKYSALLSIATSVIPKIPLDIHAHMSNFELEGGAEVHAPE